MIASTLDEAAMWDPANQEELALGRDDARLGRIAAKGYSFTRPRIIYDCARAQVFRSVDGSLRVRCAEGHSLLPQADDGSTALERVLRGGATRACQGCNDCQPHGGGS